MPRQKFGIFSRRVWSGRSIGSEIGLGSDIIIYITNKAMQLKRKKHLDRIEPREQEIMQGEEFKNYCKKNLGMKKGDIITAEAWNSFVDYKNKPSMKLNEEQAKELRTMARKNFVRIWISAIIVTFFLIWGEALIGKWLISLINVKITMREAIISAIIANFALGFITMSRKYGKSKNKKNSK